MTPEDQAAAAEAAAAEAAAAISNRIAELNAGITTHQDKLTQFLQLADFLYKDLSLIGEVHSRVDASGVTYELHLIDKPSTSTEIRKIYSEDGSSTEWEFRDLTNH